MKRLIAIALSVCLCTGAFAQEARIQLVRNATLLIDYAGQRILLDPMLSPKGALGCWSGKGETPSVELPMPVGEIVGGVDFVLVTHAHIDHFDPAAVTALDKKLKVFCQPADKQFFLNSNFWETEAVADSIMYNGVTIIRTEARHGTGRILRAMGESSGFVLKAEGMPVVYVIGDGVWTQGVFENIEKYRPDYIVVNSGGAIMPGGYDATPIIMDERQVER